MTYPIDRDRVPRRRAQAVNANGTGEVSDEDRARFAPRPGTRCKRCRRIAPRSDGIPCRLCAHDPTGYAYTPEACAVRLEDAKAAVPGLLIVEVLKHAARTMRDDEGCK